MKRRHPQRKSTSQFILEAKAKHGDKYDYSQTEYHNSRTKLVIRCPDHGLFSQLAAEHLRGCGCRKCHYQNLGNDRRTPTRAIIQQFRRTHGDRYEYSLVEYVNMDAKVTIVCKKHGPFQQRPVSHIKGHGCWKCRNEKMSILQRSSLEQILERFHAAHGDRYCYSEVHAVKNNRQKVRLICPLHGVFLQSVTKHASGEGCPSCHASRGENRVAQTLDWMDLEYEREKRFPSCRDKRSLPFDFYVPSQETLIEYDGPQHREELPRFNFPLIRRHDRMKTAWAEKHGFQLIRIPDECFDVIPDILIHDPSLSIFFE